MQNKNTDTPASHEATQDLRAGGAPEAPTTHEFKKSEILSKGALHPLCASCGLSEQAETHSKWQGDPEMLTRLASGYAVNYTGTIERDELDKIASATKALAQWEGAK
jgi:hypothetical protein